MDQCQCGNETICQKCRGCSECCENLAQNPDGMYLSTQEIFHRINTISKVVESRGFNIPKAAREKIGEELVKLGYELIETLD